MRLDTCTGGGGSAAVPGVEEVVAPELTVQELDLDDGPTAADVVGVAHVLDVAPVHGGPAVPRPSDVPHGSIEADHVELPVVRPLHPHRTGSVGEPALVVVD